MEVQFTNAFALKFGARSGFSMIELMIAMTVLMFVSAALGTAMVSSNNLTRQSRETRIASMELVKAMEEIQSVPQSSIPLTFSPGVPVPQDSVLDNLRITATYPGYVAGIEVPALLTIVLEVAWTTFDRSERTLSLTSAKGS